MDESSPDGFSLTKNFVSRCLRGVVLLLSVYGAFMIMVGVLEASGVMTKDAIREEFRSPNGKHCILLFSNDDKDQTIRAVTVPIQGVHIFNSTNIWIKKGTIYSARWTSNKLVVLFVSPDFEFEHNFSQPNDASSSSVTLDDGTGTFVITLQRLKKLDLRPTVLHVIRTPNEFRAEVLNRCT